MVRVRFELAVVVVAGALLAAFFTSNVTARIVAEDKRSFQTKALLDSDEGPAYCMTVHDVGRLRLRISNHGIFGWGSERYDCFTGYEYYRACEYPQNTLLEHLYTMGLWVGAVVGNDTLVSATIDEDWGQEFAPDYSPTGDFIRRSIIDPDSPEYEGALSEQDFIAVYYDTLDSLHNNLMYGGELSRPIGLEITQSSYAWSYKYAEDFVLFDLTIRNMDWKPLKDVYIGLWVDADIGFAGGPSDDICGFLQTFPSFQGCGFRDTVNLAWMADANGDWYDYVGPRRWVYRREQLWFPGPPPGFAPFRSIFSLAATEILRAPTVDMDLSFNWWTWGWTNQEIYGFGPQRRDNFRLLSSHQGGPETDRERYYLLSNEDFDYDQVFTSRISPVNETWVYPDPKIADIVTRGVDTRYLLSFGPFQMGPYASLPLTFAYVIGEDFHSDLYNLDNLPDRPYEYYSNVDFSDLALNAMWAQWVYDNPGFDTDGDGYLGEFRVCVTDSVESYSGWVVSEADTHWYRGDGIPDFRGAAPPPAPYFWATSLVNGLHVRFNGQRSETERDVFLGIPDFEGYRAYLGRDNRRASFFLVASYDREDYDRYVWDNARVDEDGRSEPGFVLRDIPFSLEELRCLYGRGSDPCHDSGFHPLAYPFTRPFFHPVFADSVFYFVAHDFNTYQSGVTTPIKKRFPEVRHPKRVPVEELTADDYTDDGYLKFYEYELTIENLLPTVAYWITVTAFDFGSPAGGVDALETPITETLIEAYPFSSEAEASGAFDEVYVYPNPYIVADNYRASGFELRTRTDLPDYRVHTIHFTNLPPKCVIRIHSPDGDLVRELHHDFDPSDPAGRDEEWHLVNRNRQLVVSGWYYWTVESPDGRVQMGKLVIIF